MSDFYSLVDDLQSLNAEWRQVEKQRVKLEEELSNLEETARELIGKAQSLFDEADLPDAELDVIWEAGLPPEQWDVDDTPQTPSRPEETF